MQPCLLSINKNIKTNKKTYKKPQRKTYLRNQTLQQFLIAICIACQDRQLTLCLGQQALLENIFMNIKIQLSIIDIIVSSAHISHSINHKSSCKVTYAVDNIKNCAVVRNPDNLPLISAKRKEILMNYQEMIQWMCIICFSFSV